MNQTFRLKDGKIAFEENKIKISDHARMQKYIMLFSNLFCIVCIIYGIFSFERLGDTSYNTLFLTLIIIVLIVFVINLLKSTKKIVVVDDVKSIKVKQRFNNTIFDITLKNNLQRRVVGFQNAEEVKNYINESFKVN